MKLPRLIGVLGSLGGFIYCSFFLFNNPYVNAPPAFDVLRLFTLMFFLPAIIALYSSLFFKPKLLLICFIWSLPVCLYLLSTPGIFKFLFIFPLLFLVAGMMMLKLKNSLLNYHENKLL